MSILQLTNRMIKTAPSFQIFKDENMVMVALKNGDIYKAIPDIFSSITNKLYVNILSGVSLYPIPINDILSSNDNEFEQLIINTIRKIKIKKVIKT